MSRQAKIISGFVAVVAVGYGVVALWQYHGGVPKDFTEARQQGSIIAQQIVDLSNQSTADLQKVNELDKQGNYADALALTTDIFTKTEELRNKAVDLSNQVSAMTRSLSDISSFDAQQAALESISSRLALINQLVNYSGDLGKLLDVLRNHFSGKTWSNTEVQTLVDQINTDVNAINNFNAQANRSMNAFDSIVNK